MFGVHFRFHKKNHKYFKRFLFKMSTLAKYLWLSVVLCVVAHLNSFNCDAAAIKENDVNDLVVSPTEKEALEAFKAKLLPALTEDFMKSDFYLLRWLRARGMDPKQAEDMLLQNLRWRKSNNMTSILSEDFSDIKGFLPASSNTFDKKKRPIVTISLGKWNFKAAEVKDNVLRAHRYYNFLFEKIMHEILNIQANGSEITRGRVLVDLEGIDLLTPPSMSILLRMQTTMEAYYPRFWEEIIMVNAPSGSSLLYMSIQTLLSKETQEILKIFDTKKPAWTAYLDARIERDQRYKNFGGTKELAS